jgi:hypothetical protein
MNGVGLRNIGRNVGIDPNFDFDLDPDVDKAWAGIAC